MNQTCFWCHEQRPVDDDGRIVYHDYPIPCRMVCRGSRYPSIEHIAETDIEFQFVVDEFLDGFHGVGDSSVRSEVMRCEFTADSDWPRRLATGAANPHPLIRLKIVKWIGKQIREEYSSEA